MRVGVIIALVLGGCAEFPEVDAASRNTAGVAPVLLPLEVILSGPEPVAQARGDALAAEAAALRARSGV